MGLHGSSQPRAAAIAQSRAARNLTTVTGVLLCLPAAGSSLLAAAYPRHVALFATCATLAVIGASVPGVGCAVAARKRRNSFASSHAENYLPLWREALGIGLAMVWISFAPVAAAAPMAAAGDPAFALYEMLLVPAAALAQLLLGALLLLSRLQVVE